MKKRLLRFEELNARHLLTGLAFVEHEIAVVPAEQLSFRVADFNGDGHADVVSVENRYSSEANVEKLESRLAWYENTDGAGAYGARRVMDTTDTDSVVLWAGDFDGDGDADVLVSEDANLRSDLRELRWYENTDGQGNFGPSSSIGFVPQGGAYSPSVADLDGDGDQDVVAPLRDRDLAMFENVDGEFGQPTRIAVGLDGLPNVRLLDVDADGDVDVVTDLYVRGTGDPGDHGKYGLQWIENIGNSSFADAQVLIEPTRFFAGSDSDPRLAFVVAIGVGDIDGDGDADMLASYGRVFGGTFIEWYPSTDGQGMFGAPMLVPGPQHPILHSGTSDYLGHDGIVDLADFDGDGDGDVDLLVGAALYENTDGRGDFIRVWRPFRFARHVAADVDGDGDLDVVSVDPFPTSHLKQRIFWYENRLAGDVDDNGKVEFEDFLKLSENFGSTDAAWEDGDLSQDGTVDIADFLILSANFGAERPR